MGAVTRYLLKRGADRAVLVAVVLIMLFMILRVLPNLAYHEDPFLLYLKQNIPPGESTDIQAIIEDFRQSYGLDEPLFPHQFVKYIASLVTLNFGFSFVTRRFIITELSERLPNTLMLNILTLIFISLIGFFLGWYSASRRGSKIESAIMQVSIWSYVMPGYLMGMIALILFAYLPRVTYGVTVFPLPPLTPPAPPSVKLGFLTLPIPTLEYFWYLSLPVIALVIAGFGSFAYFIRQMTVSELGQDYVLTAKAKGVADRAIMRKHVFKNVTPPVVTVITLSLPGLVNGAVITETVFSFNGMGLYLFNALLANDYPAVQAILFIGTLITVIALYLVDILVAWFDPRVRLK